MVLQRRKREYESPPDGVSDGPAEAAWDMIQPDAYNYYQSYASGDPTKAPESKKAFEENCVLYFPSNRFEEPAWLNADHLIGHVQNTDTQYFLGQTHRTVIASSPLIDNRDWLYNIIYDRAAFEVHPSYRPQLVEGTQPTMVPALGYTGPATQLYETLLTMLRIVMRRPDARFGVGRRNSRKVSIESDAGQLVPNILQLSSGEASLFNLCISILRDFDLSGTEFSSTADIRGIVLVDEVDLHLHVLHQYEILPALLRLFPKIQFILTTHSPLVVLGMANTLGEACVGLYRLPAAQSINPEEFSEFGSAYAVFAQTQAFARDIRTSIENALKPILFVEGVTDVLYLKRAAELLCKDDVLERIDIRAAGGSGSLAKVWSAARPPLSNIITQRILLLFDCDVAREPDRIGKIVQRRISRQIDNPVTKGIENLFQRSTLDRARDDKLALVDIEREYQKTVRGEPEMVPEVYTVHKNEKTNLCEWICENGMKEDFERFEIVFEILEEVFGGSSRKGGE